MVKNSPANAGDIRDRGLIPGLGRSPGPGNPLQYSCLENPVDSLAGYSPWSHKESDTTEVAWHARTHMISKVLKDKKTTVGKYSFVLVFHGMMKMNGEC